MMFFYRKFEREAFQFRAEMTYKMSEKIFSDGETLFQKNPQFSVSFFWKTSKENHYFQGCMPKQTLNYNG